MFWGPVLLFFDRVEERLDFIEVAQDRICVCLCYRERWDGFVFQIEEVAFAFLAEGCDLVDVDDVFSVASHQSASLESLFDGLQTATQHLLLQLSLAVCVPDLYVVVVRLYVVKAVRIQGQF